jgi:hypothetical protein
MNRQSVARTHQSSKSDTPLVSSILQRAAVRYISEAEMQPQEDTENSTWQESGFHHDFSRVPAHSTTPIVQPKLAIGAVGDKYEQEADRVARQVVSQIHAPGNLTVQREEMPDEESDRIVQRQSDGSGMAATPELEASIQQARGSGQPLAENVRKPMEQAFGADFSGVKVHADAQSEQLNRSIHAKAFTTGQDIFFRQGAYSPGSRGGQELIAHELTHVVQQTDSVAGALNSASRSRHRQEQSLIPSPPTSESSILQRKIVTRLPLINLPREEIMTEDQASRLVEWFKARSSYKKLQHLHGFKNKDIDDLLDQIADPSVENCSAILTNPESKFHNEDTELALYNAIRFPGPIKPDPVVSKMKEWHEKNSLEWQAANSETPLYRMLHLEAVSNKNLDNIALSCFEAVLVAARQSDRLTDQQLKLLYPKEIPLDEKKVADFRHKFLTAGGSLESLMYDELGKRVGIIEPGDMIFFDGLMHVAIATGEKTTQRFQERGNRSLGSKDMGGGIPRTELKDKWIYSTTAMPEHEVVSHWPHKSPISTAQTPSKEKPTEITTIQELAIAMDPTPHITIVKSPWNNWELWLEWYKTKGVKLLEETKEQNKRIEERRKQTSTRLAVRSRPDIEQYSKVIKERVVALPVSKEYTSALEVLQPLISKLDLSFNYVELIGGKKITKSGEYLEPKLATALLTSWLTHQTSTKTPEEVNKEAKEILRACNYEESSALANKVIKDALLQVKAKKQQDQIKAKKEAQKK